MLLLFEQTRNAIPCRKVIECRPELSSRPDWWQNRLAHPKQKKTQSSPKAYSSQKQQPKTQRLICQTRKLAIHRLCDRCVYDASMPLMNVLRVWMSHCSWRTRSQLIVWSVRISCKRALDECTESLDVPLLSTHKITTDCVIGASIMQVCPWYTYWACGRPAAHDAQDHNWLCDRCANNARLRSLRPRHAPQQPSNRLSAIPDIYIYTYIYIYQASWETGLGNLTTKEQVGKCSVLGIHSQASCGLQNSAETQA